MISKRRVRESAAMRISIRPLDYAILICFLAIPCLGMKPDLLGNEDPSLIPGSTTNDLSLDKVDDLAELNNPRSERDMVSETTMPRQETQLEMDSIDPYKKDVTKIGKQIQGKAGVYHTTWSDGSNGSESSEFLRRNAPDQWEQAVKERYGEHQMRNPRRRGYQNKPNRFNMKAYEYAAKRDSGEPGDLITQSVQDSTNLDLAADNFEIEPVKSREVNVDGMTSLSQPRDQLAMDSIKPNNKIVTKIDDIVGGKAADYQATWSDGSRGTETDDFLHRNAPKQWLQSRKDVYREYQKKHPRLRGYQKPKRQNLDVYPVTTGYGLEETTDEMGQTLVPEIAGTGDLDLATAKRV